MDTATDAVVSSHRVVLGEAVTWPGCRVPIRATNAPPWHDGVNGGAS